MTTRRREATREEVAELLNANIAPDEVASRFYDAMQRLAPQYSIDVDERTFEELDDNERSLIIQASLEVRDGLTDKLLDELMTLAEGTLGVKVVVEEAV